MKLVVNLGEMTFQLQLVMLLKKLSLDNLGRNQKKKKTKAKTKIRLEMEYEICRWV